jgi:hypothetical protein
MLATGDIKFSSEKKLFLGELGLDGTLRSIKGALPLVEVAKEYGFSEVYLPKENAIEAALVEGINIYGVSSLLEVVNHLNEDKTEIKTKLTPQIKTEIDFTRTISGIDFSDIKVQRSLTREDFKHSHSVRRLIIRWGKFQWAEKKLGLRDSRRLRRQPRGKVTSAEVNLCPRNQLLLMSLWPKSTKTA